LKLLPGDRLFLFTDGVTEAFNSLDKVYGDERLESYLSSRLTLPLEDLLKESLQEVNAFSIGMAQSDDITYLAISFNGST
jgi:sigma-B regulation protein RsbU (phosphoserine phosphatase)